MIRENWRRARRELLGEAREQRLRHDDFDGQSTHLRWVLEQCLVHCWLTTITQTRTERCRCMK